MFICDKCLKQFETVLPPDLYPDSWGNCENCGKIGHCKDIFHGQYMQKSMKRKKDNPSRRDSK